MSLQLWRDHVSVRSGAGPSFLDLHKLFSPDHRELPDRAAAFGTYRVKPGRRKGLPLVIGLILYVILRTIPVLGLLVGLVVILLGLGAISSWIWTRFRRRPAQPQPTS